MRDDWYGHRDPVTWAKVGEREEWLDWDYALIDALQAIEDYTDPGSGLLAWELEDENAYVNANRKHNKFQAAVDIKTRGTKSKPYVAEPGEYFVADLKSHIQDEDGNPVFQTRRQWIEKQIEKGN